jgi:hypothetical protein
MQISGAIAESIKLNSADGAPITDANPLPTTGGGGGGGGTLSDTVFADSTGQLFVYRDTGSGTPSAYSIPSWTLYTPVGAVTSPSAGNAAASNTGAAVPSSADYVGFNSGGNLVGVSAGTPLPVDIGAVGVLGVTDVDASNLLRQMLNYFNAPQGYDKSLQRYRQTAVIETGNLGTISTVTTVATVTNLTNITGNIGNYQANQQVFGQNQASWAALVRARIT